MAQRKDKVSKGVIVSIVILIPIMLLLSVFILVPRIAYLKEKGIIKENRYSLRDIERISESTLNEVDEYYNVSGAKGYDVKDSAHEELIGVRFYIFKSSAKAKRTFKKVKRDKDYDILESDKAHLTAKVRGVCDASITDYWYLAKNILILDEAVFGDGPVTIEEGDIQAEYNRKEGSRLERASKLINELFME